MSPRLRGNRFNIQARLQPRNRQATIIASSHPCEWLCINRAHTGCLGVNRASAYPRHRLATLMLCRGWQLQHRGRLAGEQPSDLHDPAVRKFKRVVMGVRIFQINLAKPCHLVIYAHLTEKAEGALVLDIFVER